MKKRMHELEKKDITPSQIEAYINEYKGNLFEYLVGLNISKICEIESKFYALIDSTIRKRLIDYESILRKNDLPLLKKLNEFSTKTAHIIMQEIDINVSKVVLVGKLHNEKITNEFKEADLLLETKEKIIPISLKLSKKGAYVNTKSAGVKSFIKKYFHEFKNANTYQDDLNTEVDRNFYKMGESLYQMIGIDFPGQFDNSWKAEGLADRPGQLSVEMKKIVTSNYQKTNEVIYKLFQEMSTEREKMSICLAPLVGISNKDILQVICFNERDQEGNYKLDEIIINKSNEKILELKEFELMPLNKKISSFELSFHGFQLQIRVKPMNKFTTPSYKINCSVHYGEKREKN